MGSVTNHYFHVFDGIACSGTLTVIEFMLQEFLLNDRGWGLYFLFAVLVQIGSAVGGTTSAFYGFNHGMGFCFLHSLLSVVDLVKLIIDII